MGVAQNRTVEQRLIKAFSHPVRVDALAILSQRVASPQEIAKEIREPVGKVAHHVQVLLKLDCIELVRTEDVRGATAHFYRARERAVIDNRLADRISQPVREAISETVFEAIFHEVTAAVAAGTVDRRPDRHVSWMPLTLDEEGWRELVKLKADQLEDEFEIAARAANRLAESGEEPLTALTVNLGFEAADRRRDDS